MVNEASNNRNFNATKITESLVWNRWKTKGIYIMKQLDKLMQERKLEPDI